MATNTDVRKCPYCKEEIKLDAIRCKHCRASIASEKPAHGGTCPYCKESIHPEAIRCKHCGSDVGPTSKAGCENCARSTTVGTEVDMTSGAGPMWSGDGDSVIARSGCGPCELNGGVSLASGRFTLTGTRTCCTLVPILRGGSVIYQKVCWTERCGVVPQPYSMA
jgi:hypothetical protein